MIVPGCCSKTVELERITFRHVLDNHPVPSRFDGIDFTGVLDLLFNWRVADPMKVLKTQSLASRAREIRVDCYGDEGISIIASVLGIPERSWLNFEAGVTMPAEILLAFISQTAVNPSWLLTGKGAKYGPHATRKAEASQWN